MKVDITDEYIDETTYKSSMIDVILRKGNLPEIENKFELLCKTVTYYTGENVKSEKLDVLTISIPHTTCICSCSRCKNIHLLACRDSDIILGVGSFCIQRFQNKKLNAQLYNMTKAKRCEECKNSLVFKENDYFPVNAKKGDCLCKDCKFHKVILNVPYSQKDNAKSCGAMWDANIKKWWIYRCNNKFHYLIDKYT